MKDNNLSKDVIIIGAGPVGSLLAILLARQGFSVSVFEKRANPLICETEEGRSINMALSHRGLKALKMAGMDEQVLKHTIPMEGRMLHEPNGQEILQPYGLAGQYIYSISRNGLNTLLVEEAVGRYGVNFYFNMRCESIDMDTNQIVFTETTSGKELNESFDLVIGADGAGSVVRSKIQELTKGELDINMLSHCYKELHIPAGRENIHLMYKNALHIWPRKKFMLIALPNLDGSFTATLFLSRSAPPSFEDLNNKEKVKAFFDENFPDASRLMPDVGDQFFSNPTSELGTIHCFPWIYKGELALIGDAAHPIVPFYGQGMNAGFEDCRILAELIIEYSDKDWATILNYYQSERKKNADAIARLALRNFNEMQADVADEHFLLRKKIEAILHQRLPAYLPLYSMVTFSDLSYSEAMERGRRQELFMDEVMRHEDIGLIWNEEAFLNELESRVKALGLIG